MVLVKLNESHNKTKSHEPENGLVGRRTCVHQDGDKREQGEGITKMYQCV